MKYFGTDGIRNKASKVLPLAPPLGLQLSQKHKKVAVARDPRISSFDIEKELVKGLLSGGADVLLCGVMPTPALAYVVKEQSIDCAVMITASHNPPEYNGLKVMGADGKLSEDEEREIDEGLSHVSLSNSCASGKVDILSSSVRDYKRHVIALFSHIDMSKLDRPIYLDTAHGCFSYIAKDVFETLGANVVAVNNDYDGEKINVNCGATAMDKFQLQIPDRAIGFAFDGDGDRVFAVVDGKIYDGDQILYNLATFYKSKNRNNIGVVGTIMTGGGVEKALEKQKLQLFRADVGDKYVAEMMKDKGIILGGERSGHIIIGDKTSTGDGLVTALAFLECYLDGNLKKVREYPTENYNLECENPKKLFESVEFQEKICKFVAKIGKRGRVIARPSGTESVVRLTIERYDNGLECEKLVKEMILDKSLQKTE